MEINALLRCKTQRMSVVFFSFVDSSSLITRSEVIVVNELVRTPRSRLHNYISTTHIVRIVRP